MNEKSAWQNLAIERLGHEPECEKAYRGAHDFHPNESNVGMTCVRCGFELQGSDRAIAGRLNMAGFPHDLPRDYFSAELLRDRDPVLWDQLWHHSISFSEHMQRVYSDAAGMVLDRDTISKKIEQATAQLRRMKPFMNLEKIMETLFQGKKTRLQMMLDGDIEDVYSNHRRTRPTVEAFGSRIHFVKCIMPRPKYETVSFDDQWGEEFEIWCPDDVR